MQTSNRNISLLRILTSSLLLLVLLVFQAKSQDPKGLMAANSTPLKVEVFPNPTTNYLTVDLSKLKLNDPKIEIRNIIGSKMTARTEDLGLKKYRVDVQDYPPGYYLVLVRDDKSKFQQTVRFSKK